MFCSYCGHENKDNSQFCSNCGKELRKLDLNVEIEETDSNAVAEETASNAVVEEVDSNTDIDEEEVESPEIQTEKKPLQKKKKKKKRVFVIGILLLTAAVVVASMCVKAFLPLETSNSASTQASSVEETVEETPLPSESAEPEAVEAKSAEEVIARYFENNDSNLSKNFNFLFTFYFPYNDNGTAVRCTYTDTFVLTENQYNEYSYATGNYQYYQVLDDGRVIEDTQSTYDEYYVMDPEAEYVKLEDGEWLKYTDLSGGLFSTRGITEDLKEAEWTDFSVTEDTYVLTTKFKYFRESVLGDYLDNYADGFIDYDKVIEDFDNGTIEFTFDADTCQYLGMRIYDTMHTETWETGEATYILELNEEVTSYGNVKEEDVKVPQSVIDAAVDAE